MKLIIFSIVFSAFLYSEAKAQLYISQTGESSFFSETPLENISALNKQVAAIINTATNDVAVKIQNVAFHFPNKLMEEHFNENYMETEKYPFSTFKGKIKEKIDFGKIGTYDVMIDGTLEIHGTKRERSMKGHLVIDKDKIMVLCNFDVKLADHNIEIPMLVMAKMTESFSIKNNFVLLLKK